MGTANLTMVKRNGEYKVAQYGSFDGYPSGQGFKTVKFLTQPNFTYNLFINRIDKLTHWTKEEHDKLNNQLSDWGVKYPELSPYLSADILDLIYKGEIIKVNLRTNFASNSLFCEWAWSINLDTNCLDCFKGFQIEPLTENQPFYYLQNKMTEKDKYYPIKLICSIPFDELSKFITQYDFENYIDNIIQMGDKPIMDNGVPVIWEENI